MNFNNICITILFIGPMMKFISYNHAFTANMRKCSSNTKIAIEQKLRILRYKQQKFA